MVPYTGRVEHTHELLLSDSLGGPGDLHTEILEELLSVETRSLGIPAPAAVAEADAADADADAALEARRDPRAAPTASFGAAAAACEAYAQADPELVRRLAEL